MSHIITTTVRINASREAVWKVLTDLPGYGEWSNFTSAEGAVHVGSRLKMRMPGFSFRPTISVADPGEKLQWTGTLIADRLFRGEHSFTLIPDVDGATNVINREELTGTLVNLTKRFMKQSDSNGYTAFNAGLKRQAESLVPQENQAIRG